MTMEPTPLADLVAVDLDATENPEPCSFCPGWRFEWVDLPEGGSVLRQWHLTECPEVSQATPEPQDVVPEGPVHDKGAR